MNLDAKSRYPQRQSHFAHKFTRLLFKTCAAAEIGLNGVAFCVHVAHLEDSRHYRGPIRLWNAHLQSTLGVSEDTVKRIRDKCVEHGWLHYHRKTNRSIGYYWVTIPQEVEGMPDGELEAEGELEEMIAQQDNTRNPAGNEQANTRIDAGNHAGISEGNTRNSAGKPAGNPAGTSNPIPNPKKNTSSKSGKRSAKREKPKADKTKPTTYTPAFSDWWKAYPRHVKKPEAAKAFTNAIARLVADDERPEIVTENEAVEFLTKRAEAYARQIEADGTEAKFVAHPASWLNADRFDDEYESDAPQPNAVATKADMEAEGWTVIKS